MATQANLLETLRDRVVNGEFAPGCRLKPEVLRLDYGVSASTLREILFRLSTVGLVEFQEQRGFRIPPQSPKLQHDLTQFRIMMECEGACLSIRLGGLPWEARLTAAHHKLSFIESRVQDGQRSPEVLTLWTTAELDFHRTLIDSCGSDVLKQSHAVVYHRFRQQMIISDREFTFAPENIRQHQRILDAALDHDEAMIRTRITEHLSRNLLHELPKPAHTESGAA